MEPNVLSRNIISTYAGSGKIKTENKRNLKLFEVKRIIVD